MMTVGRVMSFSVSSTTAVWEVSAYAEFADTMAAPALICRLRMFCALSRVEVRVPSRRERGISVSVAAARARVSASTIRRMVDRYLQVQAGHLPADTPDQLKGEKITAGSLEERRVDPAALDEWISRRTRRRDSP
jgi:hypothetical protein